MANEKSYLGAIRVSVKVPDFVFNNREHLREFRRQMRVAHQQGIEEGREILRNIIINKEIFDTGTLIESVASKLFVRTTDVFTGTIHFNNPGREYAYFVEVGRRGTDDDPSLKPPPISVMRAWVRRQGGTESDAWAARYKVGTEGTEGRPFMDQAERRIQANYAKIVDRAVNRFRKTK